MDERKNVQGRECAFMSELASYADTDFCYVTTTGRVSHRPHTIEIWFALQETTLYLLSGGREQADWVKNLVRFPQVQVRLGETSFQGQARLVDEASQEANLVRRLLFAKYTPRSNDDLEEWSRSALPVAIALVV